MRLLVYRAILDVFHVKCKFPYYIGHLHLKRCSDYMHNVLPTVSGICTSPELNVNLMLDHRHNVP